MEPEGWRESTGTSRLRGFVSLVREGPVPALPLALRDVSASRSASLGIQNYITFLGQCECKRVISREKNYILRTSRFTSMLNVNYLDNICNDMLISIILVKHLKVGNIT